MHHQLLEAHLLLNRVQLDRVQGLGGIGENGKENGNYYSILGMYRVSVFTATAIFEGSIGAQQAQAVTYFPSPRPAGLLQVPGDLSEDCEEQLLRKLYALHHRCAPEAAQDTGFHMRKVTTSDVQSRLPRDCTQQSERPRFQGIERSAPGCANFFSGFLWM